MKKLYKMWLLATLFSCLWIGTALAESSKAHLGVYMQELDKDLRKEFKYDGDGVLVTDIMDDSSADDAGIKSGDIIITFNGEKTTTGSVLRNLVGKIAPNDKVTIKLFRDGKSIDVKVTMKEKEENEHSWKDSGDFHKWNRWMKPHKWIQVHKENRPWLGIHMQEVSDQLAAYFKVKAGVLITEVMKESPAAKADLKAGDVIISFGDAALEDPEDLHDSLEDHKAGDEIKLKVMREGKEILKSVTLGEPNEGEDEDFSVSFEGEGDDDAMFKMRRFPEGMPMPPHVPDIHFFKDRAPNDDEIGELRKELDNLKEQLKELKAQIKK